MTNHLSLKTSRRGFSLVEVLISLTMTLIVLGAMMSAFKYASGEMAKRRAAVEMSNQLRSAQELLRQDLSNVTLDPRPWTQVTEPPGYFEFLEGPSRDYDTDGDGTGNSLELPLGADTYLGDIDDILCMTVRTNGVPYRGQYVNGGTTIVESSVAEVVWFTVHNDRDSDGIVDFDESIDVCRRVLLIRPDLAPIDVGADLDALQDTLMRNDVSFRIADNGSGGFLLVPNTLQDLARRENRFCHANDVALGADSFPHLINRGGSRNSLEVARKGTFGGGASGEDIVLTNVAAFDVRVFDRTASVAEIAPGGTSLLIVEPGDENFAAASASGSATTPGYGAFVDLSDGDGLFSGTPTLLSQFGTNTGYCTWSPHYEYDGKDQDGDGTFDVANDGLDNDNANGVDDVGEKETAPPYAVPLPGIKVTMRLIEKNTKAIRQSSVTQSFIPE